LTRGASLSAFEQLADNAEKLRLRQEMEDQQSDDGRNIGLKSGKILETASIIKKS